MGKSRKKFYAIHLIKEKKDIIVEDWTEAQKIMKGNKNLFHGFATKEEAQSWLDGITPQDEAKHIANVDRAKKKIANCKKYSIQLPLDVAEVLDGLCSKWNKNASAILEDLIRTEYMSDE